MKIVMRHEARQVPSWLIFDVGQKMRREVFIERSRLGIMFYEIAGDTLRVSGRRELMPLEALFELHALSHRAEFITRRFYRPIIVCGGLGIAMLGGAVGLMIQKMVPFGAVFYLAEWGLIFGTAFLAAALRWVPRLCVARFKDVVGRVAFDVVKERAYSAEFDEFVAQLQQFIRESKEPNKAPEPTPGSVTLRAPSR